MARWFISHKIYKFKLGIKKNKRIKRNFKQQIHVNFPKISILTSYT